MTHSEEHMTSGDTTQSGPRLLQQLEAIRNSVEAGGVTDEVLKAFQQAVLEHYRVHARPFPWRDISDPYHILVSEIMLQQTQTSRVEEKFPAFIARFPAVTDLAATSLHEVLEEWQGLGYNRRAKFLHRMARDIVERHAGCVPQTPEVLQSLPGIGPNTAGSIAVYAFDYPAVYIETNIRALFIHVFFHEADTVPDEAIRALVEKTLYRPKPSLWYNSLMDAGVLVKKHHGNPARKSATHSKQTAFEGSRRQVRGRIIAALLEEPGAGKIRLQRIIDAQTSVVSEVLDALMAEGFVRREGRRYFIA